MGYKVLIGKPEKEKTKELHVKTVNIYMGVFFDGTNNNKYNIEEFQKHSRLYWERHSYNPFILDPRDKYKEKDDGSFVQGFSNVAYLSYIFRHMEMVAENSHVSCIYVEGIGTHVRDDSQVWNPFLEENHYEDSTLSQATGAYIQGVKEKVKRGCEKIKKEFLSIVGKIRKKYPRVSFNYNLHLSVVGFSRGSAAARCFVSHLFDKEDSMSLFSVLSEESSWKVTRWVSDLMNSDKTGEVRIDVSFLGLFDTVASYGWGHTLKRALTDNRKYSDDTQALRLNQDRNREWLRMGRIFQICAADEYRKNFPLTRVGCSRPDADEIILPGCHSDIGGGYRPIMSEEYNRLSPLVEKYDERLVGDPKKPIVVRNLNYDKCLHIGEKTKKQLVDEGWFKEDQFKETIEKSFGGTKKNEIATRTIYSNYSKIPFLYMMEHLLSWSSEKNLYVDKIQSRYLLGLEDINYITYFEKSGEEKKMEVKVLDLRSVYDFFKNNPQKCYKFIKRGEIWSVAYTIEENDSETLSMLKTLRGSYLHLSSKANLVSGAAPNNQRVIVDDDMNFIG